MEVQVPKSPSVASRGRPRRALQRILAVLENGIGRAGTAAVLTNSDPAFTSALRDRLAQHLGALQQAMAADVEAGRLSARVDPDTSWDSWSAPT
jgi:hypothetical protein